MAPIDDLERDLAVLRKGAGVVRSDVVRRVGPELRRAAGIDRHDGYASVVAKISRLVDSLDGIMDERLRVVLRCELNLDSGCRFDSLTDRREYVGTLLHQASSTVRKLGTRACQVAASLLLEGDRQAPTGDIARSVELWSLVELRTELFMDDADIVRAVERRKVLVEHDGLDGVRLGVHLPLADSVAPKINADYGAVLTRVAMSSPSYLEYHLRFPREFSAGAVVDFCVTLRVARATMAPSYLFSPLRPCRTFDLRVIFGSARPAAVWLVDGVPGRSVDDLGTLWAPVDVDALGEVHHEFFGVLPGFGYGFRWA